VSYFDIQSSVGTTKHMGGLAVTRTLVGKCDLIEKDLVLDVGCGVGATASYLIERGTARAMALDLRHSMVMQAKKRAHRDGVAARLWFVTADAQHLPFADASFDGILCESVITFIEAKAQVLSGLKRVSRSGACVALNEEIWRRPPTKAMTAYARRMWDIPGEIPILEDWDDMMRNLDFQDLWIQDYALDPKRESSQVKRYSLRDLAKMGITAIKLYLTRPDFRAYLKRQRHMPKGLFQHLGYVLITGHKPPSA
jgi:ubiquinone/menaquinone biosynthesis C-methylase UbiE